VQGYDDMSHKDGRERLEMVTAGVRCRGRDGAAWTAARTTLRTTGNATRRQ